MRDLSVAIVGLGYGSTRCEMLHATPGVRLAAVADRNEERARQHGRRYGVPWYRTHEELLADRADEIDVVGVYTPSGTHLGQALDVIEAGKHLLLTKPIEVTLPRVDHIIAAASDRGVQLFSEFYLRYYSDNMLVKQAIDRGELGEMVLGEFAFKCYRPQAYYDADGAWRQSWEMNGGGIVMNQALHAIDLMNWFLGEPVTVSALTRTLHLDLPVEDTAVATLTFESGALATLVTTSTFRTTSGMDDIYGGGFTTRAEVNGTFGSASLTDNVLTMSKRESGELTPLATGPQNVFADMRNALRQPGSESSALAVGDQGRTVVAIAQAIYESSRTGEVVSLADIGTEADRNVTSGVRG